MALLAVADLSVELAGPSGALTVLRRIGRLGPDPGAMAVWSLADYVALEPFTRIDLDEDPFRPADVGVYRWFGKEIL